MKILLIHNRYLEPGGEDEVVLSEKTMLENNGHEVIYYERHNVEFKTYSNFQKLHFFLSGVYWSRRSYQEVKSLIRKYKPDLAHIHNTFSVISPSVYQACLDEKVAIVQTLHNFRFLCPIGVFYRKGKICEECLDHGRGQVIKHKCWKNSRWLSSVLKRTIDQFYKKGIVSQGIRRFIALSEFSRQKYVQNGFPQDKLRVKSNFLNPDPGVKKEFGSYVLYVGALQSYKGIDTLLKAWKKTSLTTSLKIIGDGPLRNHVLSSDPQYKIEFLGRKTLQDVIGFIKGAKFVVVPSECYENFPRVIVESYACGVPVIASRLGAVAELVEDQKTGLHFEAFNSDDLAEKIKILMNDSVLCARMGEEARKVFVEKYTAEKNYQQLKSIYEEALQ
jgi:glycosyltransferase involved in cell wall biosynthesis